MKKILVIIPKDETNKAPVAKAMFLASQTGAKLKIVDFCYEDLSEAARQSGMSESELRKKIIDHKKENIQSMIDEQLKSKPDLKEVKVDNQVIWDWKIREWILNETTKNNYDLVIKAGHRTEKAFYTPTDWHLIRSCQAPLYLLSVKKWKKKKMRILVALDVDNKSRSKKALNEQLLLAGRNLADAMSAELDCCFILQIPKLLKELDAVDKSSYTKRAREVVLPKVIEMTKPHGINEDQIYRDVGDPAGRILKIAKKLKADCVVIGSVGRKGVTGKLFGNTAEQVIKRLNSDMMVINLK